MVALRKSPEHTFQAWADRFIDRVVLPPMFTSGIDHAAWDMKNIGRRNSMAARGIKFGIPDVFVCQGQDKSPVIVWLELKRGSKVSSSQAGVHRAMRMAGQPVFVCKKMSDVFDSLQLSGFRLHPNAQALADEYEVRVETSENAPRTPKLPVRFFEEPKE